MTADCVGSWSGWGVCSEPCGGGLQFQAYTVSTEVSNGGSPCSVANGSARSQACNTGTCRGGIGGPEPEPELGPAPGGGGAAPEPEPAQGGGGAVAVDCVGSWSGWGLCSEPCGGGIQTQVYTVSTEVSNGGSPCSVANGSARSQACNTGICRGGIGGPEPEPEPEPGGPAAAAAAAAAVAVEPEPAAVMVCVSTEVANSDAAKQGSIRGVSGDVVRVSCALGFHGGAH